MMIKKLTYSLLLLTLFVGMTSCNKTYHIEGTSSVHTLDGKMLYLKQYSDSGWMAVDSAEVVHGLFTLKGAADEVRMVTLYMDEDPLMPVVLEYGNIHITIGATSLKASGTALNDRLYQFIDHRNQLERSLRDLDRKEARLILEGASIDTVRPQLEKEMQTLTQELDSYIKGFIIDNYENVLGPSVFLMLCSTMPYPLLTPQIEDIMRTAPTSFKAHPLITEFLSKAKENKLLIEEHQRLQENQSSLAEGH